MKSYLIKSKVLVSINLFLHPLFSECLLCGVGCYLGYTKIKIIFYSRNFQFIISFPGVDSIGRGSVKEIW